MFFRVKEKRYRIRVYDSLDTRYYFRSYEKALYFFNHDMPKKIEAQGVGSYSLIDLSYEDFLEETK